MSWLCRIAVAFSLVGFLGSVTALGISGGSLADPAAWRSIVALADSSITNPAEAQFCAGTLVRQDVVVTAAHCLVREDGSTRAPESIVVFAGQSDLSQAGEMNKFRVTRVVPYPWWKVSNRSPAYDVGVIRLERPTGIQEMTLQSPRFGLDPPGTGAVAGWGSTDPTLNTGSNVLLAGPITIFGRNICRKATDVRNVLCGTFPESLEASACFGDSGGPLRDSRDLLTGIVSAGPGYCGQGVTTLYTDAGTYSQWILRAGYAVNPELSLPEISSVRASYRSGRLSMRAAWCQTPGARRRVRVDFNIWRGALANRNLNGYLRTVRGRTPSGKCLTADGVLDRALAPGTWRITVKVIDLATGLSGYSDDPINVRVGGR